MKGRRLKKLIRAFYLLLIIACLMVTCGTLMLGAGFYLSSPLNLPQKADAIIALGGDSGTRVPRTLELFKAGHAHNVLIIRPVNRKTRQQEFTQLGARQENIFFDAAAKSTYEEAVNSLKLMQAQGWKHVLVVTDPPHVRRAEWTWGHVLKNTGLTYTVVATSPAWWDAEHWWRNRTSRAFVLSELKKLVYYVAAYGTGLAGH
jgi:uncharacterized SAM-binding protein YcdF (DUF218 family)